MSNTEIFLIIYKNCQSQLQRPEAPHGSTNPLEDTGSPISSASTFPPNLSTSTEEIIYESTAGCKPVV